MADSKTVGQRKEEELISKTKNVWLKADEEYARKIHDFAEVYKKFSDQSKTERECVEFVEKMLLDRGFSDINECTELKEGDKVYLVSRNKTVIAAVIGKKPLAEGVNLIGSHVDAPRLDLRPNPLYEDSEMALFRTRYYGGIKTYHWVATPLALHGVIYNKNNEKIKISIGEDEGDPVFTITDLLPHLAREQMAKKMSEGITGEDLNVVVGSIPFQDDKVSEKIKLNVLNILNEKYGIKEEDFVSAELEIVPTQKAVDIGLDRGLIGAYGHDDRICAYASLMGLFDMSETPDKTAVCYMSDKEEIGSVGNTGARGMFLQDFLAELLVKTGPYTDLGLRKCFVNTKVLSADVSSAVNPNFKGLHAANNAAFIGKGVVLMKYTGGNAKGGASDANAEFVHKVRKLFNDNNVPWQAAELGKMDKGGGGTIAQFVANLGSEVIDCGIPVIGMHSTLEVASKADLYSAYLGYKAFYEKMD
ncbi:MAG: aminopeptidase [Clostridiaceae bacterium]|nr:aminopeptidase [Clostridiaceae bacterium]